MAELRDLEADLKLCEAHRQWRRGWSSGKSMPEAVVALEAYLRELQAVYAVMEKFPPTIILSPALLLKKFGNTWGVFHHGKAVGGFDNVRAALHRALELAGEGK